MNGRFISLNFAVSVVGAASILVLVQFVPALHGSVIGYFIGVRAIADLLLKLGILTCFIFIALVGIRRLFEWNRKRRKPSPGPPVTLVKSPPDTVIGRGSIHKYGVRGEARNGHTTPGGIEAYLRGPFCPDCATELRTDEKTRLIRGKVDVWTCPGCGNEYIRPADAYLDEEARVKNLCERVLGRAEENGSVVFEERNDFHTKAWNDGSELLDSKPPSL